MSTLENQEQNAPVTEVEGVVEHQCVVTPENDGDPATVKPAWYWIKDSRGFGSVTVTLVFVAFWVTTLSYIASIFDRIGSVSLRPFDVAACASYFIPILTLYFGRRWTDANSKN